MSEKDSHMIDNLVKSSIEEMDIDQDHNNSINGNNFGVRAQKKNVVTYNLSDMSSSNK